MDIDQDDLSPLDALKADYKTKLDAEMRFVERQVNGALRRFYFKPLPMAALGKIRRVSERDTAEGVMMSFIMRALNADGKKMFAPANLTEMMRSIDADLVADIVAEMSSAEDVDDAALEDDSNPKPQRSTAPAPARVDSQS